MHNDVLIIKIVRETIPEYCEAFPDQNEVDRTILNVLKSQDSWWIDDNLSEGGLNADFEVILSVISKVTITISAVFNIYDKLRKKDQKEKSEISETDFPLDLRQQKRFQSILDRIKENDQSKK